MLLLKGGSISKIIENLKFAEARKEPFILLPDTCFVTIEVSGWMDENKTWIAVKDKSTRKVDLELHYRKQR